MKTEFIYQKYKECNFKVCTDTRKIIPNSIFFALKGKNFDGNLFALQALKDGCAYAVVDNPEIAAQDNRCLFVPDTLKSLQNLANYHRQQLAIPVIGIAGSNGKTTTKELVYQVLSKKYSVWATQGNLNNHIGVPLTLLQLQPYHQIAIVELGANHPGEIDELCQIAMPDYAIITSIGKEHLEGFGDLHTVKKTNAELYDYVLQKKQGKIFFQLDNPDLVSIFENYSNILTQQDKFIFYCTDAFYNTFQDISKIQKIIVGKYIDTYNDIFVWWQWTNVQHPSILNNNVWEKEPIIKTHLLAYHNFINALCAACIGHYFNIPKDAINLAIAEYIPDKNRMQLVKTNKNVLILDAYNANPTSMLAALEFFINKKISETLLNKENTSTSNHLFSNKNKVFILGDMFELGQHSEKEHIAIVEWLAHHCTNEKIFLVGKEFKNAFEKSKHQPNAITFNTPDEITQYIKSHSTQFDSKFILIKASRGMQLEKITPYL